MNGAAQIFNDQHSRVDINFLLDIAAFDTVRAKELEQADATWNKNRINAVSTVSKAGYPPRQKNFKPLDWPAEPNLVIQGVQELNDIKKAVSSGAGQDELYNARKAVLIGRGLDNQRLLAFFYDS
ncbi:hypothetical protein K457DRAFT_22886 [Linnemannia elongata AG-77]|uniref:Uncharacterized protein n=1 Tax=Linnemannia elongata AG-77 TaxID=1314771 RepID=A0A197JKJ6_9FUNG|nr:hypothetical protein K457DRAFT_22886 [Linnemannia elongata AG-77]